MNRSSWVWIVYGNAYVWPHGNAVHIYGYVEWARRLTGETTDARPHTFVYVTGFEDEAGFRAWAREHEEKRLEAADKRAVEMIRGRPMLNELSPMSNRRSPGVLAGRHGG